MTRHLVAALITIYQYTLSPDTGAVRYLGLARGACRFYPTCSEYTKEAVLSHGAVAGIFLGTKRILRCHPFIRN